MVRLIHKIGLATVASLWAAGVVCYQTDALSSSWCSSFRAVRFGRAALAVSPYEVATILCRVDINCSLQVFQVSVDYKWSLRNLEYGSDEYAEVIAQVHLCRDFNVRMLIVVCIFTGPYSLSTTSEGDV